MLFGSRPLALCCVSRNIVAKVSASDEVYLADAAYVEADDRG